jgi:cholesterol transport system auxiliary component
LLALLIGGCLSTSRPYKNIDYYTLEYDTPNISPRETLPVVVRIERFQVAPVYNTNKIIYRQQPFRRDAYPYHMWRANPGELVSYFLARDFQQSSVFSGIISHNTGMIFSHTIHGRVDEFFEYDEKNHWEAVLSVSITLMTKGETDISKKILFQKQYRARKACKQKNPRALAEAMSKAMASLSETMITDIYEHLEGAM